MIYLLLAYFLFLIVFLAFNAYMVFRLRQMRMKGDATGRAIKLYLWALGIIIIISAILIAISDWSKSFSDLFS